VTDKSAQNSVDYVLFTQLADEFFARYRAGEKPSIQDYIERHPALAHEIRELFPALVEMEQVQKDRQGAAAQTNEPKAPGLAQLGDFRIIREVGKGGMGIVYEAEQMSLGRHVALKVLPSRVLLNTKARRRFEREAKSAARLHHTNIVPVFGVGEHDGTPFYVMQFIQGLGLDVVLEQLKNPDVYQAATGTPAGGEPRPLSNGGRAADGHEPVTQPPRGEPAAASVARSLLNGAFAATIDSPHDDGSTLDAGTTVGTENSPAAGPRPAPAAPSGQSPSSSSPVVLPARRSDGSKSSGRKETYWHSVALIGTQVADALEYAHKQGIKHRDIKPANLLLDAQGTVWVTDFGLAKADDQQELTQTGDIVGTLRYMPPEAFDGNADRRGDIYSLGLTLYEMLAFRPAFNEQDRNRLVKQITQAEPPRLTKLNRLVPEDIATIVHKAIDKDPAQRYHSAAALADDLRRFIDDEPIKARPLSPVERLRRWCRRNPLVAATTGVASAAMVAVTVTSILLAVAQSKLASHRARFNQELVREQERTRAALREVDSQNLELRKNSAWNAVDRGQSLIEQGQYHRGLLWLVRGLELAPPEQSDLQSAIRTSLGSFQGEVPVVRAVYPHPGLVYAASRSPDGRVMAIGGLASSGSNSITALWDLGGGKPIGPALEHRGRIHALRFSPDSSALMTVGWIDGVRLWEVATGKALTGPPAPPSGVNHDGCFSPNGAIVATSARDGVVRLWDAIARQPKAGEFRAPATMFVYAMDFSPDGKTILTAGAAGNEADGIVRIWEIATGKERSFRHRVPVYSAVFSPDGTTIATAEGTTGRLWDVVSGRSIGKVLDHQRFVSGVAFSPDGRTVLTAGDGSVRLWDTETGDARLEPVAGPANRFSTAQFSKGGQSLLIPCTDRAVRLWQLPRGRQARAPVGQPDAVLRVEYSRDGKSVLLESGDTHDAEVRLWNAALTQSLGPTLWNRGFTDPIALSADGSTIVITRNFSPLATELFRLWDAVKGQAQGVGIPSTEWNVCVAANPNGGSILIGGTAPNFATSRAQQRDVTTGRPRGPRLEFDGSLRALAFSSDGKIILTGTAGRGELRLWDAGTGQPIGPAMQHSGSVSAVAFSPDNKLILSGSDDRRARLWEVASGQPVGRALVHDGPINAVAFSPDGKMAATASSDQTVRLWDALTGLPLGGPLRHRGAVYTLAFSPDGTILLTGGSDHMIRFWRVPRPVPGTVDQLKAGVELACGMTLNPERSTSGVEAPASRSSAGEPASPTMRLPETSDLFIPPPEDAMGWPEQQALSSMDAAQWQTALEHIDGSLRARPDRWLFHVLRTEVNMRLGRLESVQADWGRALALGPREQVLCWFRGYARAHAEEEQWEPALWYLDHLLAAWPETTELYVQRAHAYIKQSRTADATADYARAVELAPAQAPLWFEKAKFELGNGRWKAAADAFDRALAIEPHGHYPWIETATVHLYIGDLDGYRRACGLMLREFGETEDPAIAERVAKACMLRPVAVEDQKLIQKLAERAVTNTEKHPTYPYYMLCKGIADCRAGRSGQAIDWLQRSLTTREISRPDFSSLAHLFLSLAHHRLGERDEARQAMEKARAMIDAELRSRQLEGGRQGSTDWLRSMIVLREVQALLNENPRP
jgi:eukaryotic-like serine/threonine-protein kinase